MLVDGLKILISKEDELLYAACVQTLDLPDMYGFCVTGILSQMQIPERSGFHGKAGPSSTKAILATKLLFHRAVSYMFRIMESFR